MKRKDLSKAAKELNEVLGLDPAIDVKDDEEGLKQSILEAAELIDWDNDEFTKVTLAVLNALGKPEKEPEEKEPEEAEEEEDLVTLVNTAKKLIDLKALVEERDEFKKLRTKLEDYGGLHGPRKLRADMLELLGGAPAKKAPQKAPQNTSQLRRYTRIQAFADAVREVGLDDIDVLVSKSDEKYVSMGGKSNLKEAKTVAGYGIKFIQAFKLSI